MIIEKAKRLNNIKEYYFSKKLGEIRSRNANGENILNLAIGNPDLAPSDLVKNAISEVAKKVDTHGYQSYVGVPELRAAYAEWYKNIFSVSLDSSKEVLPLMGSKEGIIHISMAFLNEGDEVLVPNPGYPSYKIASELAGASVKYYDISEHTNWGINIGELEVQDLSKVKIMWINFPHMPTGAIANETLFENLLAFAKKHSILLCHNNPYSLIMPMDKPLSIMSFETSKEVALELNSLSKSHNMAGWRQGVLVGDENYLKTVLQVKSNMDSGMFLGLQKGAIAALQSGIDWFEQLNEAYKRRKRIVLEILNELNCSTRTKQAGMFLWAKIPEEISSEEFSEKILNKAKVFIAPGFIFGSNGEAYIRISLCASEAILSEALERIKLKREMSSFEKMTSLP